MQKAVFYLPYMPNISWMHRFLFCDGRIEYCENFVKSTGRNRCHIAGVNGKLMLSIPVTGGRDHHQLYNSVKINYDNSWQRMHWQSICSAYGSTPFFLHYAPRFEDFYAQQFDLLFQYNLQLLAVVLKCLKAERQIKFTEQYHKLLDGEHDYRKSVEENIVMPPYYQAFNEKNGFTPNLSIIDLLFNLGPQAQNYLRTLPI